MHASFDIEIYGMSETARLWLQRATPAEISMAVEFGRIAAQHLSILRPVETPAAPIKGQIGEAYIEEILRKRFGGVTNVAKTAKSGDITLFIDHRKIVVEVKNYSNAVPAIGVEKFRRDLSTTNAAGGVFVSLNTSITGVTTDFTVQHEHSDTKTVPCAYIVSSDAQAIIVAVNMIVSLIRDHEFLSAELYNKDRIASGVHEITDRLTDVSRIRSDLQDQIGKFSTQIVKSSAGLASVECDIRRITDDMCGDLFHTIGGADIVDARLMDNAVFMKYTIPSRNYVYHILRHFAPGDADIMPVWELSARSCVHASGVGFNFMAKKINVVIPRTHVEVEIIVSAIAKYDRKISFAEKYIIELDHETFDWVCDLLNVPALRQ